jgi:cytochrome bd-type quinol oxidase subunit 1
MKGSLSDESVVCAVHVLQLSADLSAQIYKKVMNMIFNSFSFGFKWICAVFSGLAHSTAKILYAEHTGTRWRFLSCVFLYVGVSSGKTLTFLLTD